MKGEASFSRSDISYLFSQGYHSSRDPFDKLMTSLSSLHKDAKSDHECHFMRQGGALQAMEQFTPEAAPSIGMTGLVQKHR